MVIINGYAGVGKDTFVELCANHTNVVNTSDAIEAKEVADICGWNGEKTEEWRARLAKLTDLLMPLTEERIDHIVEGFIDSQIWGEHGKLRFVEGVLVFIHSRKPLELHDRWGRWGAKVTKLLITNERVAPITSNDADAAVEEFKPDYVVKNNGTIEELEEQAIKFLKWIQKK